MIKNRTSVFFRFLSAAFALLLTGSNYAGAVNTNPSFLHIDETVKYRLVCNAYEGGGVSIGRYHDTEIQVYYIQYDSLLTDDCYWYPEIEGDQVRFRNAVSGEYLTYTGAKDYDTYVRLELTEEATEKSLWNLAIRNGFLNISYKSSSTEYFMNVSRSKLMVETYNGSGESEYNLFELIDETGKKVELPRSVGFSGYLYELTFEGYAPSFDESNERFIVPLPAHVGVGDTYTPAVSYTTADHAEYQLLVEGNEAAGELAFPNARSANAQKMRLLRNGEEVASCAIEFSNMPVVDIYVDIPTTKTKEEREGTIRFLSPNTDPTASSPIKEEKFRAIMRHRGATTLNYPKSSYNIKLRDEQNAELDTTLMGIRRKDKWILDAMSIDNIKMRNRVCFDIWNEFSKTPYETKYGNRNGTKGCFVEVLLNDNYVGIYCLNDRIDRALLNLKKAQVDASTGEVTVRGLLYKSNLWDNTGLMLYQLDMTQPMDTDEWNNWELQYPDDYPSEKTWTPLYNLYELCSSDRLPDELNDNFYLDNLVDFHLFVLALNLADNGNKNMHLSTQNLTKGHRFLVTPWDLDTSLGGGFDGRYENGDYSYWDFEDMRVGKNYPFGKAWSRNIGGYRELMAARWQQLRRDGALSPDSINAKLDRNAALFLQCGAWAREVARWDVRWGCPVVPDLANEIALIKDYYYKRAADLDNYLDEYTAIRPPLKDAATSEYVYRIDGTRLPITSDELQNAAPGIYIVGGKKVKR